MIVNITSNSLLKKIYRAQLSLLISSSISQLSLSPLDLNLIVTCISVATPRVSIVAIATLHLCHRHHCTGSPLLLCCILDCITVVADALRLHYAATLSQCFCCSLGSIFVACYSLDSVKSHLCFYLHKLSFVCVQFFYCIFHTNYCKILFVKK